MTKIHVLANLNARLCRTSPKSLAKIGDYCSKNGFILDKSKDIEGLQALIKSYKQKDISTLAILGGDGTISRTISELIRTYSHQKLPKIIVLGGGTANVLAQNLRVSRRPLTNLAKLKKSNRKSVKLRPLAAEGEYGFLFADGCAVSYLKKFYADKGNLVAACWLVVKLAASGVLNGRTYQALVRVEGKKLAFGCNEKDSQNVESLVTFVSAVDKIPPGITFFKNNMQNVDKLGILDFSMKPRSLVFRMAGILTLRNKGIPLWANSWQSDKVCIINKKPWSYTIDGEVFDCKEKALEIGLGPEVEFLT